MEILHYFKSLPFDIGPRESLGTGDFPESCAFALGFDNNLSLIVQAPNKKVEQLDRKIYKSGLMLSTPLGRGSLGEPLAKDFISVLKRSLKQNRRKIEECSFLEIGCGDGYLLSILKKMSAKKCLGIEPGEKTKISPKKYGLEIKRGFFSPSFISEKFDFIYSYRLLEHIKDPKTFLIKVKRCLKDKSTIFVAVPNSEHKLKLGDISILVHEHWNYFTPQSLIRLLRSVGLSSINYQLADYGGMLYAWGTIEHKKKNIFPGNVNRQKMLAYEYVRKLKNNLNRLQRRIDIAENVGRSIGLYGVSPNLIGLLHWRRLPRVFDTDKAKHGCRYSAMNNGVENPKNLLKKGVDELWITPVDYDRQISNFLKNRLRIDLNKTELVSLKKLYNSHQGR